MAYYRTAYEILATRNEQVFLVGYARQVSRAGLLKAMQRRGPELLATLAIGKDDKITFSCRPRVHAIMDGWTIGFTGRTEKESKRGACPDLI